MSNNSLVTNHLPEADGAVLEVTDHHVGQQIIDVLRRTFTCNGMKQRGDFYRDQTRELLQRCLERIVDREFIYHMCKKAKDDGWNYDYASKSGVQRFVNAIKYKCRSKEAYKAAIKACHQVVDENSMNLILEYMRGRSMDEVLASVREANLRLTHHSNIPASRPSCYTVISPIDNLDRARYQSALNSEERLTYGLHGPDTSLQEIVVNFRHAAQSNDSTDRLEPVPLMPPSLNCRPYDPRSFSADAEREIFSPYSDEESEEESEDEAELSSEE